MRYLPHTEADVACMLSAIGKPDIESLFGHLPARLRTGRPIDIAPLDEGRLIDHLTSLANDDRVPGPGVVSFLGAGLTPHTIPAAVDMLLQRAEWYTSYTPYQPEISQGTLQAIFEYQTLVAELFGLEIANASMYDGASAAAEAVLMARRLADDDKRRRALLCGTLHPHYAQTIATYLRSDSDQGALTTALPWGRDGRLDLAALDRELAAGDVACVVVQTPGFFGVIEDLAPIAERAHKAGALLVAVTTEPLAFGVVTPPGAQGADIAVGEGIGLATGPSGGGPGVGLFACRAELVRQMPGRLVGETVDKEGRRGYVLTLATREQHIRRDKATSNICTNQGLIALAFTINLCLLGRRGLAELAALNLSKAAYARTQLCAIKGVRLAFDGPIFNELTLHLEREEASAVVEKLATRDLYAGVAASAPGMFPRDHEMNHRLVLAVTERHSKADIDLLCEALAEVLR